MMQPCPPRTQLERLLLEQLDPAADDEVTRHIEGCPSCQTALDEMSRLDDPTGFEPSHDDATDVIEGVIRRLKKRLPASSRRQPAGEDEPTDAVHSPDHPAGCARSPREEAAELPRLPGYEILEEVGRGGMGVIYRARQINLDRLVAVKMLRPGAQTSATALARLRGEASVIARLHHPNIVQIHEVGDHAGQPYLALEFMAGGSLRQRLGGKPRPARDAAVLLEIVARAVDAAHSRGVIHRDLKPANILFQRSSAGERGCVSVPRDVLGALTQPRSPLGALTQPRSPLGALTQPRSPLPDARGSDHLLSFDVPKVADFGLAKLLDSQAASGGPLTHSGEVVGTPSYMAPEQARGKGAVGPAADVYALGAVLYEMLTGRPPFVAETSLGTLLRVVHEDPISVTSLCPSVPRDLATITMKCLEKEPARRYATAGTLADDLARFSTGQAVLARPLGRIGRTWRWCRRNRLAAGLLAALIFVFAAGFGIALWQALEAHASARSESLARDDADRQAALAREGERQATDLRRQAERVATLSILDQALARCRNGDIALGLLLLVDSLEKAEHAGADDLPFVIRANLSSWSQRLLTTTTSPAHGTPTPAAALSPDGRIVATGTVGNAWAKPAPAEVRLWDAATWKSRGPPLLHPYALFSLAFSPDGQRLACGGGDRMERMAAGEVRLWNVARGTQVGKALTHPARVTSVAFSPDGQTLLTACYDGKVRRWNAATGAPLGRPLCHDGAVLAAVFSPDGKSVLTGSRDGRARLWDAATGQLRLDLLHAESVTAAAFSPDGRRILTGCADHTARLWDAATGLRIGNVMVSSFPIRTVAFHPNRRLLALAGGSLESALSGQRRFGRGETRLWDATTLKPLGPPLSDTFVSDLAFSFNGRTLLTASSDGHVRLTDVSHLHSLTLAIRASPDVRWARFRPDGKALLTASAPRQRDSLKGEMRLWDATSGKPLGSSMPAYTFDRDGNSFLIHFSPDGKTLRNFLPDGTVLLRDAATAQPISPSPAEKANAAMQGQRTVFNSDGNQLCILSAGAALLWDTTANKPLGPPLTHDGDITAAAFHPDGKSLLTAGGGIIYRWDLATRRRRTEPLPPHSSPIKDLVFAADGRTFLTADTANTVRQWQTESGREIPFALPLGKGAGVTPPPHFSYSPDSQYIIADLGHTLLLRDKTTGQRMMNSNKTYHAWSAGGEWLALIAGNVSVGVEGEVRLWDAKRREFRWATPLGNCRCLDIRADGRILATGNDESAWFWDAATGKPIGPPLDHPLPLIGVHFDSDGSRLLTCCGDDMARIWQVPRPMQGSSEQLRRWIELRTGKTLDETGTARTLNAADLEQRRREMDTSDNSVKLTPTLPATLHYLPELVAACCEADPPLSQPRRPNDSRRAARTTDHS